MSIKIKTATIADLPEIQNLNDKLFELEIANFDPDLIPNWPFSAVGKKYFTKKWASQEMQIKKILTNTIGVYGDIDGMVSLPKIQAFELDYESAPDMDRG